MRSRLALLAGLVAASALLATEAAARAPVAPKAPIVVTTKPSSPPSALPPGVDPSQRVQAQIEALAAAVDELEKSLNAEKAKTSALETKLAKSQADVAALQTTVADLKGQDKFLAEKIVKDNMLQNDAFAKDVGDLRKAYLAHTHTYQLTNIKYWNKNFVTSGRPIVSDEKKDYGSYIESQTYSSETTSPPSQ